MGAQCSVLLPLEAISFAVYQNVLHVLFFFFTWKRHFIDQIISIQRAGIQTSLRLHFAAGCLIALALVAAHQQIHTS
jgi:hypothetical protein